PAPPLPSGGPPRRSARASSGQSIGDEAVASPGAEGGLPARRDQDILFSVLAEIGHGIGMAAGRQFHVPHYSTRRFINRPEMLVLGGADENHAAARHQRATDIVCPQPERQAQRMGPGAA